MTTHQDESVGTDKHPFIYEPEMSTTCYAVAGIIRHSNTQLLLGNQVVHFSTPSTGWVNQELEYVLYNILAQRDAIYDDNDNVFGYRFLAVAAGKADAGNRALHDESSIYVFRPDSTFGILGDRAEQILALVHDDVEAMLLSDSGTRHPGQIGYARRIDGHQLFLPKMFHRTRDGQNVKFDVTNGHWDKFEEVPFIFRPFATRDASFDYERMLIEQMTAARYKWGDDLFIGYDHDGSVGMGLPNQLPTSLDMSEGMTMLCWTGVTVQLQMLARPQPAQLRTAAFYQAMNTSGLYNWRRALA